MASIGLRDALAEQSYAIREVNFLINGTPTTPIDIDDVASPFPKLLTAART